MTVHLSSCRRFILTGAALLVGVALIVAAGVIPPVTADTTPSAAPERAVPAFWVSVVLHILVATVLGFVAIRTTGRSRLPTIILGFLAFLTIVLGLALTDAAFAFWDHGPALQTASILLFVCSAADLLTAALVATTAFLLPRRT